MLYKKAVRPILFAVSKNDPEIAHEAVLHLLENCGHLPFMLRVLAECFQIKSATLTQTVFGVTFPNPIGLAAGFSKNGEGIRALAQLFGFLEIGTVTPPPQKGNTRPRMFRLPKNQGLINRMGFNNNSASALQTKLCHVGQLTVPVGISLGKGKDTPLERAVEDYVDCLVKVHNYGDYFVINVSSPNTKDLRKLQDKELLRTIILELIRLAKYLSAKSGTRRKPILVKIAPDLSFEQIDEVLDVCLETGVDGIIANNTTVSREGLVPEPHIDETGGYSGARLFNKTLATVRHVHGQVPKLPIIAVGGISHHDHVIELMESGASLVQLLTGFIYEGPSVTRKILRGLLHHMEEMGITNISQLSREKVHN